MSNPLTDHITEKVFSVTEYLDLVNALLGPLKVSVEGEISDLKILPQWVFFSLKDAESGSLLRCGLHSGVFRKIGVNVEEGMKVKIFGYGKLAPKTGNFGFWVSSIEPVGEGALRRAYEILIEKLKKEGLFTRKRMLPDFISHIGVISSRNGVVIQDLLQNLRPLGIRVDFVHSGVEGADSATEILRGIEFFSKKKDAPQILILIRGGGSLESLQGFNNEEVVRALFCAPMPVLVGIGHDVDAPIATLVADWSASTPTAVAHVINESWASLTERVPVLHQSIATYFLERLHGIEYKAELALQNMRHVMSRVLIRFTAYENILQRAQKRIVVLIQNLDSQLESYVRNIKKNFLFDIENLRKRVNDYERLLAVSDPQKVLSRGYGIVYGPDGALVRHVREVTLGKTIRVRLEDGSFESEITKIDC